MQDYPWYSRVLSSNVVSVYPVFKFTYILKTVCNTVLISITSSGLAYFPSILEPPSLGDIRNFSIKVTINVERITVKQVGYGSFDLDSKDEHDVHLTVKNGCLFKYCT